jgi:mono/diheme cytochrome c family protein
MLLWASLFWLLTPNVASAQTASPEASPDPQGLTLTIEKLPVPEKAAFPDARNARLIALYVPQGTAPSSFTPPGPFRATFEGDINVRLRTFVKFSAEGRGKLTLSVGGKPILESSGDDLSKTTSDEVRLGKGKNHLVAVYESPQAGDAIFRLLWLSTTWSPEPLPPNMFTHSVAEAGVAKALQVREGRFLLAQFRCLKCHASSEAADKGAMPELAMDAPSLFNVGDRLDATWMAAWIKDPRSLRPDAHMPKLFSGPAAQQSAQDIAAYLQSLRAAQSLEPVTPGDAKNGGRIFANLDCVACHVPPGGKEDSSRISLRDAEAKFRPRALREYLLNPTAHYAWNPMPNFHLSDAEAADLETYLHLGRHEPELALLPVVNIANGKTLVASMGCLSCHAIGQEKNTAKAIDLIAINGDAKKKGCLGDEATRGNAPDFTLSAERRNALQAFFATDRSSLKQRCAPEFADRQMAAMRCTACHSRDGNESLLAQGLDAESTALHQKYPNPPVTERDLLAADQRPPLLTWTGEKLRPEWMAQFIAGKIPYKPRYYLRARMPSFAARADLIATGLAEQHGCPPTLPPIAQSDPQQAEIGRQLCGKVPNQGFSCIQCHAVADLPPFAAFEAPSINFKYAAERLRHEYYDRWVHNPQRIDPNTKMPRFEDDEGKTGLPAFNNDAQKQFEAIWQYLLQGEKIKPPG